jgi:LysR family transcriptional activator of nhaA
VRNFNHLYYFYIVAKLKSVTAAGRYLRTSQPSLTTQIKTLESNIDKQLLIKKGRSFELTPDGAKLFAICSKMFEVNDELENFLKGDERSDLQMNIGICTEIPRTFITNIIGLALKKYKPENRPIIKMTSDTHDHLIHQLKLSKVNFVITNKPEHDVNLKILKEYSMPVILAGSEDFINQLKLKNHKNGETNWKKIAGYLALPTDHLKLRSETNSFLLKHKIQYRSILESDIVSSIIRSTVDGMGFCLLPLPYIKKEIQQNILRPLTSMNGLWEHKIYIISRNSVEKNHFVENLRKELEVLRS